MELPSLDGSFDCFQKINTDIKRMKFCHYYSYSKQKELQMSNAVSKEKFLI